MERIDEFFAAVLHVPLNFLCKLTGRSNYFFAILITLVSLGFVFVYYAGKLAFKEFDYVDGFLLIFAVVFRAWVISLFKKDQRRTENHSTVIARSAFNNEFFLFTRPILLCFNVVMVCTHIGKPFWNYCADISFLLFWIGIYFAADTIPRGKGWLQKIFGKVIAAAKKPVHLPSPLPSPPPIPS